MKSKDLLSLKEFTEEVPVKLITVRRWIKDNRLPIIRLGARQFIRREIVDQLKKEGLDAVSPKTN